MSFSSRTDYAAGPFQHLGHQRRDAGSVLPSRISDEDVAADVGDSPDLAVLGKEQVRQLVTQRFAGHALTELVAAVLSLTFNLVRAG